MAWQLSGKMQETCNCDFFCPCWLDMTARPDQGWCGGGFVMDIQQGQSDGVDLSGSKAALLAEIPSTFAAGNFTARLYLDAASSEAQRQELEAIFQGRKGGVWEAVAPAFATWLPTTVTTITIEWGDTTRITVGDVGNVTAVPRTDQQGRPTLVEGSEGELALQLGALQPSHAAGTRWADPELRAWDGKSGALSTMNWHS